MKKASIVLVVIIVAVLALGVFAGCNAFGRNSEKYRQQTAITVGQEKITVGKLIDTFNSLYNSYSAYISYGYFTVQDVFEMAVRNLITQYVKVDAYVNADPAPATPGASYAWEDGTPSFARAEYLEEDELIFAVKYVKYILFSTLDGMVEDYIESDLDITLNDEETEDTSRDFVEFDKLEGFDHYSDYLYAQNFVNEDMDKYLERYYGVTDSSNGILSFNNIDANEYLIDDGESEYLAKRVEVLNSRLGDDVADEDKITVEQLQEWQKKAFDQYNKNVKSTYNYDLEKLIVRQIEDYVLSVIVAKYNKAEYSKIDNGEFTATITELASLFDQLQANQVAGFNLNSNFVSFIEGLSDSSFIYSVPSNYKYVFVKNILIPFSDAQKSTLSNLASEHGSSDDELYLAMRNQYASEIVAEDFLTKALDENDNETEDNLKRENVFDLDGSGNVIINSTGYLATYFHADGTVEGADKAEKDQNVIDLMKRFNTDTAQHSTIYDYVVRGGTVPSGYSAKWVSEFVAATNDAIAVALGGSYATEEEKLAAISAADLSTLGGTYGIAVSTYGVHIVYFVEQVQAKTPDFANNILKSNTAEYRMFKTYFETKSSQMLEELVKSDIEKCNISEGKVLKTFLKDNDFEFNLSEFLEDLT